MSVVAVYHFFYPDDVVSARHFSDLCEGLVARGWQVTALTSNRYCRYPDRALTSGLDSWKGIKVVRRWRPPLSQESHVGRTVNGLWMLASWLLHVASTKRPAVFIVGTDPAFSQLMLPFLKLLAPRSKIVFWCFDLYPDAVLADHPQGLFATFARLYGRLFRFCYRCADAIAELGPCMRCRLVHYVPDAHLETLVPWALVEPSDVRAAAPALRRSQFGDARLVLLYSGNLGRAHEFEPFVALARAVRKRQSEIVFAFSVRGHRTAELEAAVTEADTNIRILPFADENVLQDHLEAADIHLVSLRPEWAGIVVPSKFFGSLAAGRPVIFAGPRNSSIASWIEEFGVGLILDAESQTDVLNRLNEIANSPEQLRGWQDRASMTYREHFSKKICLESWSRFLSIIVSNKRGNLESGEFLHSRVCR